MKSRLLVIFLFTALFTGYGAKAQATKAWADEAIPSKIRGNWALPDCRSYEEALIITPHFYLKSSKDGSSFWPLGDIRKQKDYWVASLEGQERPIRIEADGILKVGKLAGPAPKTWPRTWDSLGIDSRHEYMGCADIPAILPDPLVRVMQHIDDVDAACHADLSDACTKLLFSVADVNKNRKISASEFKRAGMMLAGIAALVENNTVNRATLDKAIYKSMRESDRLFTQMGGKDLTYKDFDGFLQKSGSEQLHETLTAISALIPGFK